MGVRRPQRSKPDVRSTRAAYLICRASAPIQNDLAILCVCNGLAVSHRH
jgi:hypothetical protein